MKFNIFKMTIVAAISFLLHACGSASSTDQTVATPAVTAALSDYDSELASMASLEPHNVDVVVEPEQLYTSVYKSAMKAEPETVANSYTYSYNNGKNDCNSNDNANNNGNNNSNGNVHDCSNTGSTAPLTSTTPDYINPMVTAFTLPTYYNSLTVPVSAFTASDDVMVGGYAITNSSTPPALTDTKWSRYPQTTATALTANAMNQFYSWSRDTYGNISMGRLGIVFIDTIAPTPKYFMLPATNVGSTVKITLVSGTDNMSGIGGYMITSTSTKPSASSTNWSTTKPTTCTVSGTGTKTLYFWLKDKANNVSTSLTATTTIK